jgi:subfamily B ATP-binding cassette protein MsbA
MRQLFRLFGYTTRYAPVLALSVVLMFVAGAMNSSLPLLLRPVIDRVLNPAAPEARVALIPIPGTGSQLYLDQVVPFPLHNVWSLVAAAILLVFLIKGLADYAGNYLVNYCGLSAITDLRQKVFEKVLGEEHEFYQTHSTGALMSSLMNDIEKVQLAVSQMLADWLRQSFTALGLLYVLFHSDWKLALVSITVLPFVLLPTLRLGRRIRSTTRTAQDHAAELSQILQESFAGHAVVKTFGAQKIEAARFRKAAQRFKRANLRYIAQQALPSPIIEFFGALTIVGLLTYARSRIQDQAMTAGEFTGFVVALLMLYEPVKRLTGIANIFQQAIGASQRVFEYLDRPQRITDRPGAAEVKEFRESILFDDVKFRYPGAPEGFALHGVTLEVKRGEVVALVGPSGAGKTTLAALLLRFYDVDGGAVRLDGRDIREIRLQSLRALIAAVGQDTFLFNGTVANNIRYGRPGAPLDLVREAARSALCEEFIEALPEGYDTVIGERGARLSGGQRQRLAIARALIKDAPVLVLDEATSQLDAESELLVQKALANLMANRTVIVIAHRLSTIRRAGRIVVIDGGAVSEIGTHEELINQGGIYRRLHELQYVDLEN